jgi:hypothetical protein
MLETSKLPVALHAAPVILQAAPVAWCAGDTRKRLQRSFKSMVLLLFPSMKHWFHSGILTDNL